MTFDAGLYLEAPANCPECRSDKWQREETIFGSSSLHFTRMECQDCGFHVDEVWVMVDAVRPEDDYDGPNYLLLPLSDTKLNEIAGAIYEELRNQYPLKSFYEDPNFEDIITIALRKYFEEGDNP